MSRNDPVERNLIRMELRRFQTRCEAQEGSIQRADTLRQVARLGMLPIPYQLFEEAEALDTRAALRRVAENRLREIVEEMLAKLPRLEPYAQERLLRQIDDEIQAIPGTFNASRNWAQGRVMAVRQSLKNDSGMG